MENRNRMNGVITDSAHAHSRKVKVTPIEKHYEEEGEPPYIKYHCPVCMAAGNRKVSVPYGMKNCRLCGVSLNWQKPKAGDRAIHLGTDAVLTIVAPIDGTPMAYFVETEGTGETGICSSEDFSILKPGGDKGTE